MDRLRQVMRGGGDEEAPVLSTDVADGVCGSLSWTTRLRGFAVCLLVGLFLSVVASVCVFFALYSTFAILFTVGNVLSLASTCFLMGPINQIKKMLALTRLIATTVLIVMMVLTLIAGLVWHLGGLCLLFCVLQYLALAWYSISYIPFARDMVTKCFQSCLA